MPLDRTERPMYEEPSGLRPQDIAGEIAQFRQPPVTQGQAVNWYRNGVTKGGPLLAYVQQPHPGVCVDLYVPGADFPIQEGVRHITDPRMKLGHEHTESGGWDYTDDWKKEQAWKAEVERGLHDAHRKLNSILGDGTAQATPAATPAGKPKQKEPAAS